VHNYKTACGDRGELLRWFRNGSASLVFSGDPDSIRPSDWLALENGPVVTKDNLTEKQRAWLTASWEIGSGPLTRSERRRLQKLYDDMSPEEQVSLQEYIQEHFGGKEDEPSPSPEYEAITRMESKQWPEPSEKIRKALSRALSVKPPSFGDES